VTTILRILLISAQFVLMVQSQIVEGVVGRLLLSFGQIEGNPTLRNILVELIIN